LRGPTKADASATSTFDGGQQKDVGRTKHVDPEIDNSSPQVITMERIPARSGKKGPCASVYAGSK
jgi:hypothetical protein